MPDHCAWPLCDRPVEDGLVCPKHAEHQRKQTGMNAEQWREFNLEGLRRREEFRALLLPISAERAEELAERVRSRIHVSIVDG